MAAALFATDPGAEALTLTGRVHRLAVTASFPLELLAMVLFSSAFAVSPHWRRRAHFSFAWSLMTAIAAAGFFLAALQDRLPGLAERLAVVSFLVWEAAAALELIRRSPRNTKGAIGLRHVAPEEHR